MKILFTALFIAGLAHFAAFSASAADGFEIPGTKLHTVSSEHLDEDITIAVSLPLGYERGEAPFPVVVALDGDVAFGMASEIPRLMSFEASMPQVIVASVVYGDFRAWLQKRQRDYQGADGGAKAYLNALEGEVLPFLARTYRVEAKGHALYGHSSGGLFALFAATQGTSAFQRVLISSPSVDETPDWVAGMMTNAAANKASLPKVYLSLGGEEGKTAPALAPVAAQLEQLLGGNFQYQLFEGMPHMAVMAPAYTSGMMWLFAGK